MCRPPGCESRLPITHGSRRGLPSAALRAKELSSNFRYEIVMLALLAQSQFLVSQHDS